MTEFYLNFLPHGTDSISNINYYILLLITLLNTFLLLFVPLRSYCKYYDLYIFDYLMLFLKVF